MRTLPVLMIIAITATACSGASISISLGASPTPTVTATSTPGQAATQAQASATALAAATLTAQAQASSTAQAQASSTAQAVASATARVQSTSTAAAQATAGALATKNAMVAYVDALAQKAGRPFTITQRKLEERERWFNTNLELKNFVAQAEFLNPADPNIHTWDYGFIFRLAGFTSQRFDIYLRSNGTWGLAFPLTANADSITVKRQSGIVAKMDLTPTGSNRIKFVANEKDGFLFVNDDYVGMMDLSERIQSGGFYIVTGLIQGDLFPGLSVTIKNVSIAGLP